MKSTSQSPLRSTLDSTSAPTVSLPSTAKIAEWT